MRFHVTNTNDPDDRQPCSGAFKMKCLRVDERSAKSPEEKDDGSTEAPWLSEGINHRETEKGIARDFEVTEWFIDLEDFDALIAFAAGIKWHSISLVTGWIVGHATINLARPE